MPATECKPTMFIQKPSRVVEFHFECLDASGSVLSSSTEALPFESTPEDVRDDDSVDELDGNMTE